MKMYKSFAAVAVLFMAIFVLGVVAYAEEGPSSTDWKGELASDKAAIKSEKEEIKEHAAAARGEERALRQEIKGAVTSGDKAKAKELREQLKTVHQENVQGMRQDKKDLGAVKKELRKDRKAAHRAGKGR